MCKEVKENAVKLVKHLKSVGVEISHAQALESLAKMNGFKEWRSMKAAAGEDKGVFIGGVKPKSMLGTLENAINLILSVTGQNDQGLIDLRDRLLSGQHSFVEATLPRVLITVSGGIAEWVADGDVIVQHFDWDNYNQEDEDGQSSMALPKSFSDLAEPLGIPVENDKPDWRIGVDCKHCNSKLDASGWCSDDTCIFSDYPQNAFTHEEFKVMVEHDVADKWLAQFIYERRDRMSGDHEPPVQSKSNGQYTEILQHNIEWFLREDGSSSAPTELDDCSVEHIEKAIKDGCNQGELCVLGSDGDTEYRGWWAIKST